MKKLLLLLVAPMLIAACDTDTTEENTQPDIQITNNTSANEYNAELFPKDDGAAQLSSTPAMAVWQILGKLSPTNALQMGETQITDAQMKEIKTFVESNLKGKTDYDTYHNIFSWIYKNMTYASSGDAYLDPYDVFIHKRCICQGYANLLKTMCLSQGIPTIIANGWLSTIGGHAWNYVYADGKWLVSDPTNNAEYAAENTDAYKDMLIPQRLDLTLFEDDDFAYNFQDNELNVCEVKNTTDSRIVVPWSVGGLCITSFRPTSELPETVLQLYLGSNIRSLGSDPFSLASLTKNLSEVFVDPVNYNFSSYNGIVYQIYNENVPYFIPAGIKRIELKEMEVIYKNTLAWLDKLEEIYVADGTKRIEAYAVESCPNLKKVYVPESVTYIDKEAFYNCGNVEIVYFNMDD